MMESFIYDNISWSQAEKTLAKITGATVFEIEKIIRVRRVIPFRTNMIESWEELSDEEILASLDINDFLEGEIYIITDLSYVKNLGVFVVTPENINDLVTNYLTFYKECFFNGDVVVISPNVRKMFVFDHNGILSCYNLPLYT